MSRYDLRWAWRHPARWVGIVWFVLLLAIVFAVKALMIREPTFGILVGASVWPLMMAGVAGMLILASVAPLDERVQALASASLFAVSVLRLGAYGWGFASGRLATPGEIAVGASLAAHWIVLAGVALLLPRLLEQSGRAMSAEAGRDDRGGD